MTEEEIISTAKAANKVIHKGLTLMTDDMKADFKSPMNPEVFINAAIENAIAEAEEPMMKTLVMAYSVQEANRVVSDLWREKLLTEELEAEYRELPKMKTCAEEHNKLIDGRNEISKKIEDERAEFMEGEKRLQVFQGIISGLTKDDAEKKYNAFLEQQKQAVQGTR